MEGFGNEEYRAQRGYNLTFLRRCNLGLPDLTAHLIFWPLALVGLGVDLWSKSVIFDWLAKKPGNRVSVIDGVLRLMAALNDGAAFGIAAEQHRLLVGISAAALVVIVAVFLFGSGGRRIVQVALGLFAAGICGNLWDRIFNGGLVRDFIDVTYWPGRHWPTFNVADSLLCIGVGLLLIATVFTGRQSSQRRAQQHR